MTENDWLRQENEALRKALRRISDPIADFQEEARMRGTQLDGMMCVRLAEDHNFLKQIARDALTIPRAFTEDF